MLIEIPDVRQVRGEGLRRWFCDSFFDLIVWYANGEVTGFQLCYDKGHNERALTWHRPRCYTHARVDDGEGHFGTKETPVLVQDGLFDRDAIVKRFRAAAAGIDPTVVDLVCRSLAECPASTPARRLTRNA